MNYEKLRNFLLLVILACCWGPSFLFVKIAIEHLGPITLTLFRVLIAVVMLYVFLIIKKIQIFRYKHYIPHFLFLGIVGSSLPFTLFGFAEQVVSSSIAAIINGMVPLMTIVIANFAIKDEYLTKNKLIGAITGFIGLAILVAPQLSGSQSSLSGMIMSIVAVICYSVALIHSRKYIKDVDPVISSTMQLSFATLFLFIFAVIFENPLQIVNSEADVIMSVLFLAIFGTFIAFILLYKLLKMTSASYVSMVNYIVPIIGVILGVVVLREDLTLTSVIGCLVIISGVGIANGVFARVKKI